MPSGEPRTILVGVEVMVLVASAWMREHSPSYEDLERKKKSQWIIAMY